MSKSLGNFSTLAGLLDVADARAYRLLILQSHWRAPVEITPTSITQAGEALSRLDDFARRTADLPGAAADQPTLDRFRDRMDDDLDTPAVSALLFDTVRLANRAIDEGDPQRAAALAAAVREMTSAVGLELASRVEIPPEIAGFVLQREDARNARDFASADALRDRVAAAGYTIEDTPQGPRVHRTP
jgi:cysteinyl-tRNA synthetase